MDIVTDITARRAALTPDRPAFHDVKSGEIVSFAALEDRCARAATLMADRGVGPGDRVAILCRNRVEFFEALFGCAKLGAILAPLNWRMPARELADLLADCAPSLLLTGAEDTATAAEAAQPHGTPLLDLEQDWPAARNAAEPHPGRPAWPGEETWYLIYTSGTTGRPKGVIQTYRMALVNYVNISQAIGLRDGDASLNFLPLFHTAGINLHTLPVLMAGGLNHILPGFEAGAVLDLINAGRLDVMLCVPAVYRELALHPDFATTDLTRLRHWACGGAPMPDVLIEQFAARGAVVCNGFGMTETGPTAFLMDREHALDKIGSVGKPQLLIEARIATPEGRPLPAGETGEVQFFGPGLTPGYWHCDSETAQLFTPDGWLKSGDLGRFDDEGYCYIAGRIKEMYISGGENVYPAEVENLLDEHPAILEAAVTGIADEKWGEVGCAHLILREGQSVSDEALRAWCRERMAAYKVPRHFLRSTDFPRTAAGKVQKHLLPRPEGVR
ncbi:acid--CoA ligase [Maricaulis sp. W15]|uniref:acyl-CoA synthetase n=1 Tax=Maricaulis sp. W15 TaxID=1772333 RepID=UPI000948DB4F|nr:long-chain fatty acid--CoA ligase [Maricaulis sp. W15]OLF81154.1 acid--CoA ligase [Maricaulis sp. W15]